MQRLDIFLFVKCWVVRHYGYGESGFDCEVLVFPVYFQFDFVVVVFIRLYSVDLRYLFDFFGFTFFFFVAVYFRGVVYLPPVCSVSLRLTLAKCPNLWQLLHSAVFAGHLCSGVKFCCLQNPQSFFFCVGFPVNVFLFGWYFSCIFCIGSCFVSFSFTSAVGVVDCLCLFSYLSWVTRSIVVLRFNVFS